MFTGRIEAERGSPRDRSRRDQGVAPSFARWLPVIVGAMIEEILDSADEAQCQGFFQAIGARIAGELSLEGIEDSAHLVDEMNSLWNALDWGEVTIELDDEGVDIFHHGLPNGLDRADDETWSRVAPQILVGAYEHWFRSLGSGPNLHTQLLRQSPDLILLRHGF